MCNRHTNIYATSDDIMVRQKTNKVQIILTLFVCVLEVVSMGVNLISTSTANDHRHNAKERTMRWL